MPNPKGFGKFIFSNMQEKLKLVLEQYHWTNKQIIVAVSGGVDSMVLAELLRNAQAKIVVAHCNFGLRGADADADEQLVKDWAEKHQISCYVQHFETRKILDEQGGNLQETARDLRYNWFEQLRLQLGFDLIATAHHAQDAVETMLMNFFKGTGIAGLHGILPQQNKIIRPLLTFKKEDIKQYAVNQNIAWREDASNQKDDYLRNEIRHHFLPMAEKMFPNATNNLIKNIERFREVELLYNENVERYRSKLIEQRNKDFYIPILKLKNCKPVSTLLWELIKPFGFSPAQLDEVLHLLIAETGRYVASSQYRVIKNRNFLIITPTETEASTHVLIAQNESIVSNDVWQIKLKEQDFEISMMDNIISSPKETVWLDVHQLKFPLILRPWKTGDYFYPLGMNKKKKKVSKFLIEQKIPLHEKANIWVLESDKKIAWVVGMRTDERFKIKPSTLRCLSLSGNKK